MAKDVPFRKKGGKVGADGKTSEFGSLVQQPAKPGVERQAGHRPAGRSHPTPGIQSAQVEEKAPGRLPCGFGGRIEPGKQGRVFHPP